MRFLAAAVVVVALASAGCGGGSSSGGGGEASKSGQQVLADTLRAVKAASSFHVHGQSGAGARERIGIDMTLVKGKGATGSLTLNGQTLELMVIGTDVYVKGSAALYRQFGGLHGATAARFAGKWLKFPTADPQFGKITTFASPASFYGLFTTTGALANKGAATYHGQRVVDLVDGSNGTLYVAATGPAYPVALVTTADGSLSFDGWNKAVTLTAPPGAISTLGG